MSVSMSSVRVNASLLQALLKKQNAAIDFHIFLQSSQQQKLIHQQKHDFAEFFTVIFL
jgi:hypothetical protein